MPRDSEMYLDDIEVACEKIIRFTVGMSQADFASDEKTFAALRSTGTRNKYPC